jgi:hypothetical protein
MSARVCRWLPAALVGLVIPAVASADPCCLLKSKPCPAPATAPPVKVIVEMSPPEVTFKQAAPTCVKCPVKAAAPAPSYAPAPAYAPAPVYAPAPMAAPIAYVPVAAPMMAPVPQAAPCAAPGAYSGFPQAAPGCGAGGYAGPSAGELRALADALDVQERAALQQHLSFLERQYSAAATKAAAAGLSPAPLAAPRSIPKSTPQAGEAPPAVTVEQLSQRIDDLQDLIKRMSRVLEAHQRALEGK